MSKTDKQIRGSFGPAGILDSIDNLFARLEEFIMAVGIILMAVNTITNVISRFIFNHSIIFAEELNSTFILLVTFAGMGYAARHGRHIRMSAIYDHMPDKVRKVLMITITAVTAMFMLLLAYYSVQYLISIYSKGRIMPALGVPVYVIYLWVPIGFFITGIQYALTAVKNIKEKEIYLATNLHEHQAQEIEV
ncbi:MAG: TRAP transporter small permease [Gammaproteobacteria bacterium]|nr:TRAP transporter small permease [Gammaproteobacteria bacterium]MDH3467787.1 TRAP transporter small permease [Gammaproteobacteria bacterium]